MIIWSTWGKTIIILGMVQIHENTVHPPRAYLRLQEETVGGYIQADEVYTQHWNYFSQCNWFNVSTLVQKSVGIEATTLYSSTNQSFLYHRGWNGKKRCSVRHCHTCMVPEMFLPEALKWWGRQSNGRTCLSLAITLSMCSPRTLYKVVIIPCAQTEQQLLYASWRQSVQWTSGAQI